MKTRCKNWILTCLSVLFLITAYSQSTDEPTSQDALNQLKQASMETYLIERELPGAGALTQEQLKGISQKSCDVIDEMGSGIQWMHSYVTDDKVYCLYKADDVDKLKLHAEKGGFPITKITPLSTTISPLTAKDETQKYKP